MLELLEFIGRPMEVAKYTCHSQRVERAVKKVTAAADVYWVLIRGRDTSGRKK